MMIMNQKMVEEEKRERKGEHDQKERKIKNVKRRKRMTVEKLVWVIFMLKNFYCIF